MDSLVYSTKDLEDLLDSLDSSNLLKIASQIRIRGLQIWIRTLRVQIGWLQIWICETNPWICNMNPRVNNSLIRFPHPYFFKIKISLIQSSIYLILFVFICIRLSLGEEKTYVSILHRFKISLRSFTMLM
jgi:hypothetical protein